MCKVRLWDATDGKLIELGLKCSTSADVLFDRARSAALTCGVRLDHQVTLTGVQVCMIALEEAVSASRGPGR